jgi:hypothetical protein
VSSKVFFSVYKTGVDQDLLDIVLNRLGNATHQIAFLGVASPMG